MSKQLIKILVICALVVICPLVIVGVALMSQEAVGCTLTIYDGGVEKMGETDFGGKSSNVTIMVDGKAHDSNKITLTKRSEVTVTYEGVGYDFVGWFNGNYNEINVETDKVLNKVGEFTYTFEIEKDTVLTAVRNVKTFNVSYAGNYDDNSTVMDVVSKTYEYNEPLATVEAKSEKYALAGWHEYDQVEDVKGSNTKVANFGSKDVTLYPTWERQYKFEFYGVADYELDGDEGTWALKGTKNGNADQWVEELGTLMYFNENPTDGYYDLNQNVCDYFLSAYSDIKTMNGDGVTFANQIKIYYKLTNNNLSVLAANIYLDELNDNVLSFADVLEYIRTAQGSLDNIALIDLTFIYNVQA